MARQEHHGEGDNVFGDKIINFFFKMSLKQFFIVASFLVIILIVYFVWEHFSQPAIETVRVESENGKPVSEAEITIFDENANKIAKGKTDTTGKVIMQVPKLGFFERPRRIEVEYGGEIFNFPSHEDYEKIGSITNLSLDTLLSPFYVKYYNLSTGAIDFLLEGKISDGKGTTIDNMGILLNPPLEDLIKLKKKHNITVYYEVFKKSQTDEKIVKTHNGIKDSLEYFTSHRTDLYTSLPSSWYLSGHSTDVLYGTGFDRGSTRVYDEQPVFSLMSVDSAISILDKFDDWVFAEKGELKISRDNIKDVETRIGAAKSGLFRFARKQASPQDIIMIRSQLSGSNSFSHEYDATPLRLLDHFVEAGFPKGFAMFELKFNSLHWNCIGDVEEVDYFYCRLDVYLPLIRYHIAVIENTSNEIVELSSVNVKELSNDSIRLVSVDNYRFAQTDSIKTIKIGTKLMPSEKYIIPLYCYLEHDYYKPGFSNYKYILGSSQEIQSVNNENFEYQIAKFDPSSISIYGKFESSGSCPYAYTYSGSQKKWILEDHILLDQDDYSLKGYDTIKLSRFTGELKIKELDPETSYIDFIEVICRNKDDNTYTSFRCTNTLLSNKDDVFLELVQGDSITLIFDGWLNSDYDEIKLVSNGYYEVY